VLREKLVHIVDPKDNVGTALSKIEKGETAALFKEWALRKEGMIKAISSVPKWYKVSIKDIPEGEKVIKFGYAIGTAAVDIKVGSVVHLTHVILTGSLDVLELMEEGFELGIAKRAILRGDIIRVGENLIATHPSIREKKWSGKKVGIAVADVAQGGVVMVGNLMDLPLKLGWNEKYARIVSEFYKLIRSGYVQMS